MGGIELSSDATDAFEQAGEEPIVVDFSVEHTMRVRRRELKRQLGVLDDGERGATFLSPGE